MKRTLSLLLSVLMILSVCAVPAFAAGSDEIELNETSVTLAVDDEYFLYFDAYSVDDDPDVDYWSSDEDIALVDVYFEDGEAYIYAGGVGTATITIVYGSAKATCKVTVINPADDISFAQTEKTLAIGKQTRLTPVLTPDDATEVITWKSSNSKVAKVSYTGCVTAVSAGTATITAETYYGYTATCKIKVTQPVTAIKLNETAYTVQKAGCYLQLKATVTPTTASDKTVTWTSSNKKVATVDKNGKVTIIGKGTAVITAKAKSGVTATCKVVCKTAQHDHLYKSTKVASTCTKKGYTYSKCVVCGDVTRTNYKKALGHTWVKKSGVNGRVCSTCGTKYCTANGHNWKAATCTAAKTCKECKKTSGKALGHNWTSTVTKKATCTAKGKKTVTCTTCKKKVEKTISPLGHSCKNGHCTRCDKSVKGLLKYYIKKNGYYDDGYYKLHVNHGSSMWTTYGYDSEEDRVYLGWRVETSSGYYYNFIMDLDSECKSYSCETYLYDDYATYFHGISKFKASSIKSSTKTISFSTYDSDYYGIASDMKEIVAEAVVTMLEDFNYISDDYGWGLTAKSLGFTNFK